MGVTIHYTGKLDDPEQLHALIQDMKQKSRDLGWPYTEMDDRILGRAYVLVGSDETPTGQPGVSTSSVYFDVKNVDDRTRGIFIQPPGTEIFILSFDRSGRMVHYDAMPGPMQPTSVSGLPAITFGNEPGWYTEVDHHWVKTTGRIEEHVLIVALLRHLKDRYISDLEVGDEGDYWETMDLDQLKQNHERMQGLISAFKDPERIKELLALIGMDDVGDVKRVETHVPISRPAKPDHMKDWGISAHEN
jgi:hypothetical protein